MNIFSSFLSIKRRSLLLIVILGVVLQILGFINTVNFLQTPHLGIKPELWWTGRGIEGFYLGLLLSGSIENRLKTARRGQSVSLRRLLASILSVIVIFFLIDISNKFIFLAALIFYFFIREILLIDENSIPFAFRKACMFLGKISYGIYVFHEPVSQILSGKFLSHYLHLNMNSPLSLVLGFILKLMGTLVITLLSLRIVEVPFRRWASGRFLKNAG